MAKNFIKPRKHETGRSITTKTPYGTTSDMIVSDQDILSKVNIPGDVVLVKDDAGYYTTFKERVDSGLADPRRYSDSLRISLQHEIEEQLKE